MKTKDKIFDTIVDIIFFFIINLGVSALCMISLEIRFNECLFYSLINATWMPILIPALLNKIEPIDFKKNKR